MARYFDIHPANPQRRAIVQIAELVRADEKQKLSSGAVPIDQAMQMLEQKGRMGASPVIVPAPEKVDISPMQGWIKMPAQVPAPLEAAASAAAPAPAPSGAPSAAPSSSTAPPAGSAPPPSSSSDAATGAAPPWSPAG